MSYPVREDLLTEDRLPSVHDQQSANQLRKILASQMTEAGNDVLLTVLDADKKQSDVVLGPILSNLLIELLRAVGSGNTVISVPLSKKMSTQEAADVLNVSRPHLIKLLERGDMPYETVGRHRRVEARYVFAYQSQRNERRSEALSAAFAADADYL